MQVTYLADDVIRQLIHWAERQDSVRAALLTGSRTNPTASIDRFSDYDVVLVVEDIHPLASLALTADRRGHGAPALSGRRLRRP